MLPILLIKKNSQHGAQLVGFQKTYRVLTTHVFEFQSTQCLNS